MEGEVCLKKTLPVENTATSENILVQNECGTRWKNRSLNIKGPLSGSGMCYLIVGGIW